NDRVAYTNFLILDSFHKPGGLRMIRRDNPEESLLLQYALPRNIARYRHPEKIRSAFRSRNDPGYRLTLQWIRSLKGPLHPDYRIKYLPPNVMKPVPVLPGLPAGGGKADKGGKDQKKKKDQTPF
ncbi:MAG: hypothetical protein J7M21_02765, partial [Planctomycetes bacterium]|nr:hypothetical protein [Planctomycetota bacterium]